MQLFLQSHALDLLPLLPCQITQHPDEMTPSTRAPIGDRQFGGEQAAVFSSYLQFSYGPQIAGGITGVFMPQVGRQEHPHVLANNLGRKVTGHALGGLVELLDAAMLVRHDNGAVRGLQDGPVSSLALTQLVLVLTQASLGSLPCLDLGSKQIPDLGKLGRAPFICAPGAVNMRQA